MWLLAVLVTVVFVGSEAAKSYEGYRLLAVDVTNDDAKRRVRELPQRLGYQPDFLGETRRDERHTADFFLDPSQMSEVVAILGQGDVPYTIRELNPENYKLRRRRNIGDGSITATDIDNRYLSFDEQMRFLNDLAQSNSGFMKLVDIGQSFEGRPLRAVRLGDDGRPKPIVWIDAGTHAREWISHSAALYFINTMVTDPGYRNYLESVQLVVVPNTNPDGYEFSRTNDRMWRKTRSRTGNRCLGADANRNYPFFWGQEGVSHSSCSEIYCGSRVMSEVEVASLVTAISREESRIRGYASLHSYGQEILYPWGHTVHSYPPDVEDLKALGQAMADAIRASSGSNYTVVNSGDGLYPAAGASDDWAKSRGVKYSYTLELAPRDDDTGFLLPETKIASTNRDAFAALFVLVQKVATDRSMTSAAMTPSVAGPRKFRTRKPFTEMRRNRGFGRG